MKNYALPLAIVITLNDFLLTFLLLAAVLFFVSVLGGPMFHWAACFFLSVLFCVGQLTLFLWIGTKNPGKGENNDIKRTGSLH